MATFYGPWAGSGFRGRLVVDVSDPPGIGSDTGGFRLTSSWYAEFSAATYDSNLVFDSNGTFEAAPSTVSFSRATRVFLGSRSAWVEPRFDTEVSIWIQGDFTGVNNIGSSARPSINARLTIPRKPYKQPRPPVGFGYGKTGETQATLWWGLDFTGLDGAYPWSNVRVGRQTRNGPWEETLQFLGWDATSAVDSSLSPDRCYTYAVRSEGPGGVSGWVAAPTQIYTKPTTPNGVAAAKDASGAIVVTWNSPSTIAERWEVWHKAGATWETTPIATTTSRSWTHVGPSVTETHAYRVVALTPDGTRSDNSGESGAVQLLAAPNAPTDLTPSTVTLNHSAAHTRAWRHNSRDSTPQSAWQIQTRASLDSGATWGSWAAGAKITSTASSATVPAGTYTADSTIQWQVRTWGAHAAPSAWSATSTYAVSALPVTTILSPSASEEISADLVTVTWAYAGSAIQATYTATLIADGRAVETRSGVGVGTTVPFLYRLSNNTTYTVELTTTDANGLVAPKVTRTFSTKFIGPPPAQVVATWDADLGSVTLSLYNPAPTGTVPPATSVLIERKVGDTWFPLGTHLPDPVVTDPIPTQGVATYRLTSLSALGAATSSEVQVPTVNRGDWIWVNHGPTFGLRARVRLNAATSSKLTAPSTRHSFAGRKRGVSYYGDQREFAIAVSALTEERDTAGNREAWWRAGDSGGVVCFRDHLGRRIFGSLSDISFAEESDDLSSLTFSVEEDDYAE